MGIVPIAFNRTAEIRSDRPKVSSDKIEFPSHLKRDGNSILIQKIFLKWDTKMIREFWFLNDWRYSDRSDLTGLASAAFTD